MSLSRLADWGFRRSGLIPALESSITSWDLGNNQTCNNNSIHWTVQLCNSGRRLGQEQLLQTTNQNNSGRSTLSSDQSQNLAYLLMTSSDHACGDCSEALIWFVNVLVDLFSCWTATEQNPNHFTLFWDPCHHSTSFANAPAPVHCGHNQSKTKANYHWWLITDHFTLDHSTQLLKEFCT